MPITPSRIEGPNLIYPNGGEIISTGDIDINWIEPFDSSDLIWIEILFTETFDQTLIPEWKRIALIPSGTLNYTWKKKYNIKSKKCRIGLRAISYKGDISDISISANNFEIEGVKLSKPAVIEPISGSAYFSYIPIILDKKGILGKNSQRAYYNIYYSSHSQRIDWTLLKSYIPVDTGPIYWDIRNVNQADDYELRVELCDNEDISEPTFINNIKISGLNYFLIDTLPPKGSIKILNNQEYTKDKDISIKLSAFDKTTEVKDFRIEQSDQESDDKKSLPFEKMTDISTWQIKGDDGSKLIQVRYRDYAGNIVADDLTKTFFRTYKSVDNLPVLAFLIDGSNYWMAFAGANGDIRSSLYLNQQFLTTLAGEATAMCIYEETFYISTKTSLNTGELYRYSGGILNKVIQFDSLSTNVEIISDCIVNSMAVYDDKLFIGLQNGYIYYYNGSVYTLLNSEDENPRSIHKLTSNSTSLFVFLDNSEDFYMYNATLDQYGETQYILTTVTI